MRYLAQHAFRVSLRAAAAMASLAAAPVELPGHVPATVAWQQLNSSGAIADARATGDLGLTISVLPFARSASADGPRTGAAAVELAIHPTGASHQRTWDVTAAAVDGEERTVATSTREVVSTSDSGSKTSPTDAMMDLDLPVGDFTITVTARDRATSEIGRASAVVVIPDFAREPLSMSGIWLGRSSKAVSPTDNLLERLDSFVPTLDRSFQSNSSVAAAFAVYQTVGGGRAAGDVSITERVLDNRNRLTRETTATLAATELDAGGSGLYVGPMSFHGLRPGTYTFQYRVRGTSPRVVAREIVVTVIAA